VDQASGPGEIGRILRREGIYHSLLSKWRQQRAEGIELGLSEKARGVKGPSVKTLQEENRKLQRQKARLEEELRRARIIIEFQKKAAALFEPTETEESYWSSPPNSQPKSASAWRVSPYTSRAPPSIAANSHRPPSSP
jgi:transposase-like protein